MKIRIEWDVAWRIFDHVNENNDSKKHIDLNCLDINEAISITKQQIYDVAQKLKPLAKKKSLFASCSGEAQLTEGKDYQVLSVQCADDHYVFERKDSKHKTNAILKMI